MRSIGAAALILTLAVTATACTSTPGGSLNAKQVSGRMQTLVRDTMKVAGGEWTSASDGPAPDPCSTPAGEDGVTFSRDQTAPGVDDPKAVMERVDQAWRDEGLPTNTHSVERGDGKILHRVGSTGKDVDSILFAATTSRMTIEVQSLCGEGNVDDFT
ncbi:hypothetical protein ACO0E1_16410 [Curtobacterium sp. RRHDQ66]|uniref:hypothetical protein n=1 Tax=Curtobacterium guangdongense TaxID=3413380 RepID=UPI003BF0399E